jgi:Zn-dependent protease
MTCSACGGEIAPALLACPSCHSLVHAAALKSVSEEAARAAERGDLHAELQAWRGALDMLPAESRQFAVIRGKVDDLSKQVTAGKGRGWRQVSAGGAVAGGALLLWKLKAILIIAATKGKLLLLGLTKSSTLFSMIPTFGIYWAAFGWRFAAGLILSIYIHEMGHVAALARYGIRAGAPMFIPGLGAFVRLKQAPLNAREDARVGLAGPEWGLGAAIVALVVFLLSGVPVWGAIAGLGAYLNLFNLLPVWQLDGARGFRALSRPQRWTAAGATALAGLLASQPLLYVVAAVGGYRAWRSSGKRPTAARSSPISCSSHPSPRSSRRRPRSRGVRRRSALL